MKRNAAFYIILLLICGLGIAALLHTGMKLPAPVGEINPAHVKAAPAGDASLLGSMGHALAVNFQHPLSHLFLQLLVIIGAARVLGGLFTRFGQPAVIGEMMAGILLGPSLFGMLAPEMFQFVFPVNSLGSLKLFSQIGVCLFMFVVGMELNMNQVRNKAHTAVMVSHASIVVPFLLGVILAYFLFTSLAQP